MKVNKVSTFDISISESEFLVLLDALTVLDIILKLRNDADFDTRRFANDNSSLRAPISHWRKVMRPLVD